MGLAFSGPFTWIALEVAGCLGVRWLHTDGDVPEPICPDAVLYLFVLAFLWVSFYLYTRCLRLEREITALTRHVAIKEATKGENYGPTNPEAG